MGNVYNDCLVFRGTFVHTPEYGELDIMYDKVVVVQEGKIQYVGDGEEEAAVLQQFSVLSSAVRRLKDGQFVVPGFIDTHVHAPQYKFTGTGTDLPLMEWLRKYTFPVESSYSDPEAAQHRYSLLVKRYLGCGTTTANYFGTIHLEASKVLADTCHQYGQRAVIGKVNMDRESPPFYIESTADGLRDAEAFVKYVRDKKTRIVYPCIQPRFIPTCTMEMLKGLAQLANQYDTHIHSHISECCGEVAFVRHLHPEHPHDTSVFTEAGLLTNKCIMAHGTLLRDDEMVALAAAGTSISHCPYSNFFLGDACFRVNHAMKLGLKVGLGSDMAGGISPSMLTSMRMAVVNARALRAQKLAASGSLHVTPDMEEDVISYKEALYLATLGGARALALESTIGTFDVGKDFDALVIDVLVPDGPFDIFDGEPPLDQFEKFMNLGDDRNLVEVYVAGVRVKAGPVFTGEPSVAVAPSRKAVMSAADEDGHVEKKMRMSMSATSLNECNGHGARKAE